MDSPIAEKFIMVPNSILAAPWSPSAKLVYGLILSLRKHGCKLTNKKIGERCGLSNRRVTDIVAELTQYTAIHAECVQGSRVLWATQETAISLAASFHLTAQETARPSIEKTKRRLRDTKKPPSASQAQREADPRHDAVRLMIQAAYNLKNDAEAPWDGHAGAVLKRLLRRIPGWNIQLLRACIENRFLSEANHSEEPALWIGRLPSYRSAPLSRFKTPQEGKYDGIERAFAQPSAPDGPDLPANPSSGRSGGVRRVV